MNDESQFLSESERNSLRTLVESTKGGLTNFAKEVSVSDLTITRAIGGLKCQRGSIRLMRDFLSSHKG